MIAIVSSGRDTHGKEVLDRLKARGADVALLDLSTFPQQAELAIEFDGSSGDRHTLRGSQLQLDFAECGVVWWRRPQPFMLHPEVTGPTEHSFAYAETQAAFSGLWLTLGALWINHPTRDEEAGRKVYQLKVAKELGFRIPDTCITNSPAQARRFIARQGDRGTIYKAFSGTEQAWRETRLLKPEEVELMDAVRYAPVIFQEYIPAEVDLRITMVGDSIFPAAIYSQQTSYKVDFRMTMDDAAIAAVELPESLQERLRAYMTRLGLVYGAIDMRLTPDGTYVFLEINPSGQWLFVENRTELRITDALVDLMLSNDRRVATAER